jgi:hypothetical protein
MLPCVLAAENVVREKRVPIQLLSAHPVKTGGLFALAQPSADDLAEKERNEALVYVSVGVGADAAGVGVKAYQLFNHGLQPGLLLCLSDATLLRGFSNLHSPAGDAPIGALGAFKDQDPILVIKQDRGDARLERDIGFRSIGVVVIKTFLLQNFASSPTIF